MSVLRASVRRVLGGILVVLGGYGVAVLAARDERYVWVVNPGADSVSVIRTSSNQVVETVRVGEEPASIALDPNNRYAFVANADGADVTVIRIQGAGGGNLQARVSRTLETGA